jgi:hypothetical protein
MSLSYLCPLYVTLLCRNNVTMLCKDSGKIFSCIIPIKFVCIDTISDVEALLLDKYRC